jgi:hypothetical protein
MTSAGKSWRDWMRIHAAAAEFDPLDDHDFRDAPAALRRASATGDGQ